MVFESRDVAAYIAQECKKRGLEYNNTKIQKLLYCAYGCLLAWKGERICDEYPRAWQFGPVFPRVFRYIHKRGDIALHSSVVADAPENEKASLVQVVDKVLEVFGKMSASALSAWSHKAGSPWDIVVNGDSTNEAAGMNSFMPDEFIRHYFREKVLQGA